METQGRTEIYEFDDFRLDARQRVLSRRGNIVPLPPKTIHLLVVLIQNHGRLLEKDELLSAVWPDTFVEETALAKGIHLLRKTLGEPVIVTFPKRGYSFVAPLTEVEAAVPEHLPADESAKEPASAEVEPLPVRRRSVRIAGAAVMRRLWIRA